ncbi:MAG: branched-chain amino acid ABC transporter permease, partial [Dehalococcoidia bacterium]|nr:branched-chain amino acid ABC transporter permease [Dehalococcoidia bacterium]
MRNKRFIPLIFLVLAIVVLALPLFLKDLYHLHVLITVFLNVVLAASLLIIVIMGEVSLAHSGFVGIGAYTSAILVTKLSFPFWISLPLAGVVAVIVAVIIGFPTLRLTGVYFFLVTFALAQVIKLFFMGFFTNLFGGGRGI